MPILQLVSQLPAFGGLPADRVENVVNIGFLGSPTTPEIASCITEFTDFYDTVAPGATLAVGSYISEDILRPAGGCSIFAYETADLTGGTPFGSPVGSGTFTMPNAQSGGPYP